MLQLPLAFAQCLLGPFALGCVAYHQHGTRDSPLHDNGCERTNYLNRRAVSSEKHVFVITQSLTRLEYSY
jgi:hypothetical protein